MINDIVVNQKPVRYTLDAPIDMRVRKYSATVTFIAIAPAGTLDTMPAWRIGKIIDDGAGNVDICFANGNPNPDKVFEVTPNDENYRTAYSYSK